MFIVHPVQNLPQISSQTSLQAVYIIKNFSESTHFNPYAKDSTIFTKYGLCLEVYKVSQLRRLESKPSPPQKSQNLHNLFHFQKD
jgi:hypothetical protein